MHDFQDDLIAYVPVRRYELTLRHRLLSQLGDFSHLILEALVMSNSDSPDLTSDTDGLEIVSTITGLTRQQLHPILTRLQGVGLVSDNFTLTSKGRELAKWQQCLHDKPHYIWLDCQYRTHDFWGNDSLMPEIIDSPASCYIIHDSPTDDKAKQQNFWSTQDWNEDCERQKRRLLHRHEAYFHHIFGVFNECFPEGSFYEKEWELVVRYTPPDIGKVYAISVPLDTRNLLIGHSGQYKLLSPVLCLKTSYSLPTGFPASLQDRLPEDSLLMNNFSKLDVTPEQLLDEQQCAALGTKWYWPNVDEICLQNAVPDLLKQLKLTRDIGFNRQYRLIQNWQPLSFNRDFLIKNLKNTPKEGIFFVDEQEPIIKKNIDEVKKQTTSTAQRHTQNTRTKLNEHSGKRFSRDAQADVMPHHKAKQSSNSVKKQVTAPRTRHYTVPKQEEKTTAEQIIDFVISSFLR
ncbi:hypothetical protein [Pelistega europaea]|uniref:Uncharacterized protein n=1 Tax=Pelistega europaea TaxID=106147 RepID=A0A7Y4P6X8_9BURK|nr:hypothetical protein [Pelistega europaea]NOL50369.1 hypothetical protein [Pelistega europaea]